MENISADAAKTCLEKLINKAITESRYVCCFTSIAEDFEKEREPLKATRKTLGDKVKLAESGGEVIRSDVTFWEAEADKLIQEDTKTKKTLFFGLCPNLKWRYRRGKELANNTVRIEKLIERGDNFENVGLPARLPGIGRYSSQHYISFKSRESKYKELLDALADDSNYIVGLQGMGGTGKTTLAIEAGKRLEQSKQFAYAIDTTVSNTPDIKKIQDDIAGPLGLKWEDCSESDRPKKLWSRLTNGDKILLILDDVWGHINFDEIGIPYSDNNKGCRVLVTTRNRWVCNKMGCEKTIQLKLLSEEDAWIMFKRYAAISDSFPKSVVDTAQKIANECKGLPVAISVIASSLRGQQNQEEWDVALKSLQNPVSSMHDVDESLVEIYKCLKFSYDYMNDEKAKGLFLLCSVFQEDAEISTELLTRLGIGVGLFGEDYGTYEDARREVVKAKNKLLSSCLLLETHGGSVKMHDLVREVAQRIANKEIQTLDVCDKISKALVERNRNIKYLLCEGRAVDASSCRFDGSKLEILIFFFYMDGDSDNAVVPTLLFENNIAGLRSLHLNNTNWRSRKHPALSLSQSIESLTNIRSLLVNRFDLGDISVLGNLHSLETLDLDGCAINELPLQITKLKKFKLLKLKKCEIRRNNPFQVIRGCSSLEELYFINSFNRYCREITFPKLQRYHVYRKVGIVRSNESQSKCVAFDANVGGGAVGFFSEETFKYCMQTAEVLHLRGVKGEWRNIIPDIVPIDQGMNDLVELDLCGISQLQCLIDTNDSHVPNVFSKLVELRLDRMENLEALCNGPISFDLLKSLETIWITDCRDFRRLFTCKLNLCNLKRMTLEKCPMLVSLFQLSTSRSLVLLEDLTISNCERLESIIIIDDDDERGGDELEVAVVDDDNKSRGLMFSKLKSLYICGCPKLECLLPFLSARDLPVLETIDIRRCDGLKYIFGQDVKLGSLQEMCLQDLPNFIGIFPEYHLPMSSFMEGSSSAYREGSKPQTQSNPIKCNIFSWTHICCYGHKDKHKLRTLTSTKHPFVSEDLSYDYSIALASNPYRHHIWERAQCLPIQPHILCNIKEMELSHFSKIKSMFILSIAPRMLLETLAIMNCDELKHIIVDSREDNEGNNWENVFPKLKELYVENCGQLEYIFGHYALDHQNNNEIHLHLPVLKCLTFCKLPSLIAMCPKNYRTTFPPLTELQLDKCSQFAIKSIGDFIYHSIPRSLDSTSIKELSGNMEHFRALERLKVHNAQVENIFCLHEINGQLMNLALQNIELRDLLVMTYLFKGPKNSFNLQNLIKINIVRCEKLKIIFSTSIIRCLPQLVDLRIEECMELKYIIEYDDMDNQKMSNSRSPRTCFPKLKGLAIVKCNKLKCVFPDSICKRLPELKVMMIREADELEEIFRSEGDHNVEIPNLKVVALVSLPSLCQTQGFQFRAVEYRFVQNCQKLSLTSAPTQTSIGCVVGFDIDLELRRQLGSLFEQLQKDSKKQDKSNENPSARTIKDIAAGVEVEAVLAHELTSSHMNPIQIPEAEQEFVEKVTGLETPTMAILPKNSEELLNEQSMGQQYPLGETDTTVKASQGNNNSLKETADKSIQEGAVSEKIATTILSTNSETRNEPPIQLVAPKQKGIKRNDEEGTTFANTKTITSLTHSKSVSSSSGPLVTSKCKTSSQEYGDGQIAMPSFSITKEDVDVKGSQKSIETNDHVKMSLIIEEKLSVSKDDEIRVSQSKPSLSIIPSAVASQSPSIPSEGNPSQIVEDLSFSSLIIREIQQLASKKHLAYENLPLLTDFLAKHPSVRLMNNSLSNRYKGYAYNCLAELLKFLQTQSVLDVLGSNHSQFVELLQDVRSCGFDKEWLDGVEKRALFPDFFHVSQDAVLQKLLEAKCILSQHVEDLRHQLASSEAFLESIIQQEAQVLEAKAALSTPLGY